MKQDSPVISRPRQRGLLRTVLALALIAGLARRWLVADAAAHRNRG